MAPSVPPIVWIGFCAVVLVLLGIDILAHRGKHGESWRRAIAWTVGWVAVAVIFGAGVWWWRGPEAASTYLAAYLLEKSLSIDNLFVFLVIFHHFGIPRQNQRRVLSWGIFGALVSRGVFIAAGAALLERWSWTMYVFGAILVLTALRMLRSDEGHNPGEGRIVHFLERHLPYRRNAPSTAFFVREKARLYATPLLLALITIELSDVLFAVDSIPAAFAVTNDTFIIYSANVLAVLGLRSLYIVLARSLGGLKYLRFGLVAVLAFAGAKMLAHRWVEVPALISLAVIIGFVGISVLASVIGERRRPGPHDRADANGKAIRPLPA